MKYYFTVLLLLSLCSMQMKISCEISIKNLLISKELNEIKDDQNLNKLNLEYTSQINKIDRLNKEIDNLSKSKIKIPINKSNEVKITKLDLAENKSHIQFPKVSLNNNIKKENKKLEKKIYVPKNRLNKKALLSKLRHQIQLENSNENNSDSNKPKKINYSFETIKNDSINKQNYKEIDTPCILASGIANYVSKVVEINSQTSNVIITPVRISLTKSNLSIFLDNDDISILNSIRLEDIITIRKKYSENCSEIGNSKKNIVLCFDNIENMISWALKIKNYKKCFLVYEDKINLLENYKNLLFLQEQQFKLEHLTYSFSNSTEKIDERLNDMYYNNNQEINRTEIFQDQQFEKKLIDIIEKPIKI